MWFCLIAAVVAFAIAGGLIAVRPEPRSWDTLSMICDYGFFLFGCIYGFFLFGCILMSAMCWHFARSRGRTPAWFLLGWVGLVMLFLLPDLSLPPGGEQPAPTPTTSIGKFAFTVGDAVTSALAWIYEKIRYHPRDEEPPSKPIRPDDTSN
jgi:hypothetical protein